MAYVTDTDAVDSTMTGDGSNVPKPIINLLKKRAQPNTQPNLGGAGADGTANGGTSSSGVRSSKPVVQDTEAPEVLGANPKSMGPSSTSPGAASNSSISDVLNGTEEKPVAPQLAQQGSSNPVIRAVQKATGFVKASPAPGEKYTAPVSDDEKSQHLQRLGVMLHGVQQAFQGLQSAVGSNPQQQRGQELPVEEEKTQLQSQQLENTLKHQRATENVAQQRVGVADRNATNAEARTGIQQEGQDTKQQGQDTRDAQADAGLRLKGYKRQGDGSVAPMTAQDYTTDPTAMQNEHARQAVIELHQAEQAHAQASADLANDPNNIDRQLRKRGQDMALQAAQARVSSIMAMVGPRAQQANLSFGKEAETIWAKPLQSGQQLQNMRQSYQDSLNGNQQAMVNLVANHVGMTLGGQPNMRIGLMQWQEAMQSAPWLQRVEAHFDPNTGYLTGVVLSPEQMQQMLQLGEEKYRLNVQQARSQAELMSQFMGPIPEPQLPIDPDSKLPTGPQAQIGPSTKGGVIGGPAKFGLGTGAGNTPAPASAPAPKSPVHKATTSKQKSPFE